LYLDHQIVQSLFPGTGQVVYFNTATMALGATPVREAYERALSDWVSGHFDYAAAEQAGETCRRIFAGLVGALPEEIALIPSVSSAAGVVAAQLGPAQTGDNIVVADEEFTSNYFPWLLLRDMGYDVRTISFSDRSPSVDDYAAAVNTQTRLLAVSAVQSSTGAATDLVALAEIVHRGGGWLFVDACQAAGAVPLNVHTADVDFLATASHKFLCGTRGMGYLFVRSELVPAMRPVTPGWKAAHDPMRSFYGPEMKLSPTASKLDTSLAWFAALGEQAALRIFEELGPQQIFEHNRDLIQRLHERMADKNMSPQDSDGPVHSTIISIPVKEPEEVMRRFTAERIIASIRAGRVRISLHFYNSPEQVDLVATILCN